MTTGERAGIRETRLRIVTARAGADVLRRARGPWKVEAAVVTNGLETTAPLRAGQVLKVAVEEPYVRGL